MNTRFLRILLGRIVSLRNPHLAAHVCARYVRNTTLLMLASICVCSEVMAQSFNAAKAREILSQNPQLEGVADLPSNLEARMGSRCNPGGMNISEDHKTNLAAQKELYDHVCIHATAIATGLQPYEKGYGKKRNFTIALYPETPRVWRVYESGVGKPGSQINTKLLAEFDQGGTAVSVDSRPSPATGALPVQIPSLPDPSTAPQKQSSGTTPATSPQSVDRALGDSIRGIFKR